MMARRLFSHQDDAGRVSRPAISISTLGVAIGVAVMLISVSVALGFQREVQAKLLGFGAHIQVFSYESLGSEELKPIVVDEEGMQRLSHVPGVKHVQRFSVNPGMLNTYSEWCSVEWGRSMIPSSFVTTWWQVRCPFGAIPYHRAACWCRNIWHAS